MDQQGDRCTLFYTHKCLDQSMNDADFDQLTVRELTVTECLMVPTFDQNAFVPAAAIETLTGFVPQDQPNPGRSGCDFPDEPLLEVTVNAETALRDTHNLFVQTIQEVNLGTGTAFVSDVFIGASASVLRVREIRDFTNNSGHVYIPFIGTGDIDEAVLNAGIVVRPNVQFVKTITFGNPSGAPFEYDNASAAVTFRAMTAGVPVVGVPQINMGFFRFHIFGKTTALPLPAGTPLVTMIYGSASVVMANAPFGYYESTVAVIPAGYIPVQAFEAIISTQRDANPLIHYQGSFVLLTNGFIRFYQEGDDQGLQEGWFSGDNGKTAGVRAGSCSYEAVAI